MFSWGRGAEQHRCFHRRAITLSGPCCAAVQDVTGDMADELMKLAPGMFKLAGSGAGRKAVVADVRGNMQHLEKVREGGEARGRASSRAAVLGAVWRQHRCQVPAGRGRQQRCSAQDLHLIVLFGLLACDAPCAPVSTMWGVHSS